MRTVIIGTSGQLATSLRQRPLRPSVRLLAPHQLDITNRSTTHAWLDSQTPNLVINAGAYTAVDRAESEPERAFAVNEFGPRVLAEWCSRHHAALIHVSTDYVFDGAKSAPYVESDAPSPLGVYGASKLEGERQVRELLERHVIVRTSWVFSAHGHNFVKTISRLARDRDELRVVSDQHGRPTAATDLADALLGVAEHVASGTAHFGTFHYAGLGATTWCDFARAIVEEQAARTGRRPRIVPISTSEYPTPARRPANSTLDTNAFEAAYRIHPRSWRAELTEVIAQLFSAP